MKKLYVSPIVLMLSVGIVFISFIAFYYNLKSLKYVLNQEVPTLSSHFNKDMLLKAVEKFNLGQNATSIKASNSSMLVLAIAYSENPAYSMVLVKSSCGKKVLMIGDEFCGFTIEEIKPFYIIAGNNGKAITLKLSKGEAFKGGNASYNSGGLPSLKELLSENQNTFIINRNKLLEITSNPYKMFSDIDLVPTSKGFMFKSVKPGSLFSQMGIKPGDILVSINNETLNSPEDAFRILGTLRNSDSFSVKILRNNKPMMLYYKVD